VADFTTLKTNVSDRGFARLSPTQLGKVVNDAVDEVDALEPRWPYLQLTVTGTLPLVTADMSSVSQVVNTSTNLPIPYMRYEDLASIAGSLAQASADPAYWYFTPGSTTSISGFPVSTRTVRLVYWKVSPDLSAGGDTPLAPARWHQVDEDVAVRNAMRMKNDYADAAALQAVIDGKIAAMRTDLLYRQTAGPSQVMPAGYDNF
jgi:hypothetical protein